MSVLMVYLHMKRRRLTEIRVGVEGGDMSYPRAASWLSVFFARVLVAEAPANGLLKQLRTKTSHSNRFSAAKAKCVPSCLSPVFEVSGGSECLGVCFESRVVGLCCFELFQDSDSGST